MKDKDKPADDINPGQVVDHDEPPQPGDGHDETPSIAADPAAADAATSTLPEAPLESGMRRLGEATAAIRSGTAARVQLSPEEHAACSEYMADIDASPDPAHESNLAKRLLNGETVQAA